jgi:hypothetical protein
LFNKTVCCANNVRVYKDGREQDCANAFFHARYFFLAMSLSMQSTVFNHLQQDKGTGKGEYPKYLLSGIDGAPSPSDL